MTPADSTGTPPEASAGSSPAVPVPTASPAPSVAAAAPAPVAAPAAPAAPAPRPAAPATAAVPGPEPTADPARLAAQLLLAGRPDVVAAQVAARAARDDLDEELARLEASIRAAVDVKARIRRNPKRVAGAAAGVGFLAVGGPRRVLRGTRSLVFGKPDPLPDAMLPEEIEKALKALGSDGARVRGAIERDFAKYLRDEKPQRRDLRSTLAFLVLPSARVLILRFGRQFIDELLSPRTGFAEQLERVRARRAGDGGKPPAT